MTQCAFSEKQEGPGTVPLVTLKGDEGADVDAHGLKTGPAPKVGKINHEAGGDDLGPKLAQEASSGFGRSAGRDQVVDEDNLFACRDGIHVHLHLVQPV